MISVSHFPDQPGVYIMKGKEGKVLYIGKAKNLKSRLRQYFSYSDGRPMISFLIPKVLDVETIVVHSEKEALLLESNLIKQYKPPYNALLKDDKSYIALKITKHAWPRIDIVRYRGKPKKDGLYFGPYSNVGSARRTLDLIHKVFPLRQCSDEEFARRSRPCILYDMKRCIAPCVQKCSKEEYDQLILKVIRFLRGQDKEIVKELYFEMEKYSDLLEFEKAQEVLDKIRHIEKTIERQHVDRPLGDDSDAIGIYRQADEVFASVLFYRGGRLMGSRHYRFSEIGEDDPELVERMILQLYSEDSGGAKELLLPLQIANPQVLASIVGLQLVVPQKGEKRTYVEMAELNAEAEFKKRKDEGILIEKTLIEMQEKFHLTRYPKIIECFDTSHLLGDKAVAAQVAFVDGKKDTKRYRRYQIKESDRGDDYAMLGEVLRRRFAKAKEENNLPDLLIVDGGKGQLGVALHVFKELNIINVDLIALAKEKGLHTKAMTQEGVFLPNLKDPIHLGRHSSVLFFLQKMRDEAHRFAIDYHRNKQKKGVTMSKLDEIPGIGPVKKKRLLRRFGSLKKVLEATAEELLTVPGVTWKDIENLLANNRQNPL
jgi:excinuclease ABC subunit C